MEDTDALQKREADILQEQVSDVYQKTLLSIPASVTSFFDNSNQELNIDSEFLTEFIRTFSGSRLDNVTLSNSSEESRRKVVQLFKAIERDLFDTRNSPVDMSDCSGYKHTLKMYLADRKVNDAILNDAYYTVRNMAGKDPEAAALVQKVKEKRDQIRAYMRTPTARYSYTRKEILSHFVSTGIIKKVKNENRCDDYTLVPDAIIKRPTEVEELMNAFTHVLESAKDVSDAEFSDWVGQITADAYNVGQDYLEQENPNNSDVKAAVEACERVGYLSQEKGDLLWENTEKDEEAHLDVTADPYMRIIFNMIRDGKVTKDKAGPITVTNVDAITPDDIIHIYNNVKTSLFALGPKGSTAEKVPVEFDANFDSRMNLLKPYIDFLYSDELKPAITKPDVEKRVRSNITDSRKKLAAAYILMKSVHDTFNKTLMQYSKTDIVKGELTIPSYKKFISSIKSNCSIFPKSDIDLQFVFNALGMFTTETAYFPIEQIIHENPNLYTRMCQYRKARIDSFTFDAMQSLANDNVPVQYIGEEFVKQFNSNKSLSGVASIDGDGETLSLSTMMGPMQFLNVFNALSDGIAYAAQDNVNDRITEYRLWSMLKTLANRTPKTLGLDIKHEFMNVAHAQDDLQYRLHLAVKAGVVVKGEDTHHFSGNFGTVVNGVNVQARRNNIIMESLYKYVCGVFFTKANEVFHNKVHMNILTNYFERVFAIAKEYNLAFYKQHAEKFGCSDKHSTQIITMLSPFVGG